MIKTITYMLYVRLKSLSMKSKTCDTCLKCLTAVTVNNYEKGLSCEWKQVTGVNAV